MYLYKTSDKDSKIIQSSLQFIKMKLNVILFTFLLIEFVQSVPFVDQILPKSVKTRYPDLKYGQIKTHRLPNNSIPLRYDLWLKTEADEKNFNFSGRVKIHIKVLEPTQIITLHSQQIVITKIDLLDVSGSLITDNLVFDYDEDFDFLKITLPTKAIVSDELMLDIAYTSVLSKGYSDFDIDKYHDTANKINIWFVTTQFEMTGARSAMPCYDEPAIRAVIGLEIQHTKNYGVISNMPVVSRTDVDGTDHVTTKFQDTIPIPSYMLAFAFSDFDSITNFDVTNEQRMYADQEKTVLSFGDFAVDAVLPVLRKFKELFGIDYPLSKMDHASLESMKKIEVLTHQRISMMYLYARSDYLNTDFIEKITEDLAHQFFEYIVAPKWWSYSWLNEGLVNLFKFYIPSLIYPENHHMENLKNFVDFAFDLDVVERNALPLNFYAETPAGHRLKYDSVSSPKGASLLIMFMEAMTVPSFMKGLKFYLTDMYLKSATPDDLQRNLQKAYDEDFPSNNVDLGAMMSTWGDQAGYPMIHVTKTSGGFHLNQSRFGGGSEVYSIPVSYTTNSELDFETKTAKLWMTTPSATIKSNDDWVILNIQSTGYYKVSYSNEIWDSFIETLNNNHAIIPTTHRVEFMRDMLSALKKGTIAATSGLSVSGLNDFFRSSLFGTEFFDDYLALVRSVTQPHLSRLGFTSIEGESSEDSEMRNLLMGLSCSALDPLCLKFEEERRVVANETGDSVESFDLCSSLRNAPADVYEFYLNDMLIKTNENILDYFITNLGCTLNAELLEKFSQASLDNTTRLGKDDRQNIIFKTMKKSRVAFEMTLSFIKTNFIEIHEM